MSGCDGAAAYAPIAAGEMTGTVDIVPMMTGEIGLEVAEQLVGASEDSHRKALLEDE